MKKILFALAIILAYAADALAAGSTTFRIWDQTLTNIESDASYSADAIRSGGALSHGILPSVTFNKAMYQQSVFISALAQALANKGYTLEDGSAGTSGHDYNQLVTILSSLMTATDTIPNADKVDNYHAGNSSGQVPVSNGTVNTNLNAQYHGGYAAGNSSGQICPSNGSICTNLNANYLQGYAIGTGSNTVCLSNDALCSHLNAGRLGGYQAGNGSSNIPVNNGVQNTGLNAQYVGGYAAGTTANTLAIIKGVGSSTFSLAAGASTLISTGITGGYAMFSFSTSSYLLFADYNTVDGTIRLVNNGGTAAGTIYWKIIN